MKKLWPYVLGVAVLVAGVALSSHVLPKSGLPASPPRVSAVPAPLRPIRVERAPEVLYFLVAEALVEKLKTGDLLLTVREYRELTRQTSQHLREDLGLELPPGFSVPSNVPRDWLEHPQFSSVDHYGYIQQVHAANRDYLQNVVHRLLDEHAPQTVQLMMERITAIRSFRTVGDSESLSFVKALYGDHFTQDYAAAHAPTENKEKPRTRSRKLPKSANEATLSAKEVAAAEAQVSSLWRTEFRSEELPAVREYILNQKLQDKLREDLLSGVLSVAERGLMEKNAIGYRVIFLHDLTRKVLSTRP
jgi:hypothetical protein